MLQYRDIGLTTKIRGADGENVFFFLVQSLQLIY